MSVRFKVGVFMPLRFTCLHRIRSCPTILCGHETTECSGSYSSTPYRSYDGTASSCRIRRRIAHDCRGIGTDRFLYSVGGFHSALSMVECLHGKDLTAINAQQEKPSTQECKNPRCLIAEKDQESVCWENSLGLVRRKIVINDSSVV